MNIIDWYVGLSPSIKSTIIVTFLIIIFLIIMRIKLNKYDYTKKPKGIILLCEWFVDFMNTFTKNNIGKRWKGLAPYLTSLALFLIVSNLSGLLGLVPPTASLSVTLTLGIITFVLIHFYGIRSQGLKGHFKGLCDPSPLILPLNIISEVITPFSLGLRLFGNILSGLVLMTLIYGIFAAFGGIIAFIPALITPVFHAIFDVAFGLIQTIVFVMLTTVFIAGKLPEEELNYKE